jgi:hypothetical protein
MRALRDTPGQPTSMGKLITVITRYEVLMPANSRDAGYQTASSGALHARPG